jgi:Cu2+-exporting ATPase
VAESVSKQLKMDGFFAEVLPHQKLEKIRELQRQGEFIAMTGDGVNDAPALAQADIGIAVGSGSDIAAETAGIVLVNSNPKDIVNLILFGKATYQKMIQNLAWATGYNVITLPLAAGVLYNHGILLSPAIGAVLMTVSTVVVAINAGLLKVKIDPFTPVTQIKGPNRYRIVIFIPIWSFTPTRGRLGYMPQHISLVQANPVLKRQKFLL